MKKTKFQKPRRRVNRAMVKEIGRRFTYVDSLTPLQMSDCEDLRARAKDMAMMIARTGPMNRERCLALTKLEDALHYGIAAIVRPDPKGE
jgi:hypothetical protein